MQQLQSDCQHEARNSAELTQKLAAADVKNANLTKQLAVGEIDFTIVCQIRYSCHVTQCSDEWLQKR
jgi:hypothetical protein